MKKDFLIGSFIALLPFVAGAQDFEQPKANTRFEIKAGVIQSDLYGKDLEVLAVESITKKQNSFFVGVSFSNEISKHFGLRHELFYQEYGSGFNRKFEEETIYYARLKMRGLKINPISPTFKIGGLEMYAGPYINILLNSSITALDDEGNKYKDRDIFGTGDEDTETYKYLQKMDYGLVMGMDYVFKNKFSIGVYYSRGFAPLLDNANSYGLKETPGLKTWRIYNVSYGLSIGMIF